MMKINGLGERIRSRRRALGMSQELLARALAAPGLPPVAAMTVSRWERGQRAPSRRHRHRLAEVLGGIPADYEEDDSRALSLASASIPQQPLSERHQARGPVSVRELLRYAEQSAQFRDSPGWEWLTDIVADLLRRAAEGRASRNEVIAAMHEIEVARRWRLETVGRDAYAEERSDVLMLLTRLTAQVPAGGPPSVREPIDDWTRDSNGRVR